MGLKLAPSVRDTRSISLATSMRASRRSRIVSSRPLAEMDWTRSDSASRLSAATSTRVRTAGGGGPKRSASSASSSRSAVSKAAIFWYSSMRRLASLTYPCGMDIGTGRSMATDGASATLSPRSSRTVSSSSLR